MKTLAILIALGSLLLAGLARAQTSVVSNVERERSRIVLVASPQADEMANQFTAELVALRFEVIRAIETEIAPSIAGLEAIAEQQAAGIAVRLTAVGATIDVWVVSPVTDEFVYRRVPPDRDPGVAVLRALEILRGALTHLGALTARPDPEVAASVPKPASPRPTPRTPTAISRRPSLGLAGTALWPRAGRDFAWGMSAGLHYRLGSRFQLHASGLLPIGSWTVAGPGGQGRVWVGSLAAAASVLPWRERTFTPSVGLGVGALALHTRGDAQPGFRGTSGWSWSAFPHGRLAATLELWGPLRLRVEGLAGFALPRAVLLFDEQRQASWINPLLTGSLGLEVSLR